MKTAKTILLVPLLLGGCTGQLKLAIRAHAASTRAVAQTLTQSAAAIQCSQVSDPSACAAAVSAISLQARTLLSSADALDHSAQGGL